MVKKRPHGPAPDLSKGERTRQSIVESAAAVFNQRGFEGSSVSELMAVTGLKKGGIYRHFESKEQLAVAAFDYAWDTAWSLRMRNVDTGAKGLTRVKQLIANFVTQRSPIAGGCPLLNTAIEADDGKLDVLRARALEALDMWMDWVRGAAADAVKAGEACAGVDPQEVAVIVVATLEGALMMSRLKRSDLPLRHAQRHLFRYLDQEVASPPPI